MRPQPTSISLIWPEYLMSDDRDQDENVLYESHKNDCTVYYQEEVVGKIIHSKKFQFQKAKQTTKAYLLFLSKADTIGRSKYSEILEKEVKLKNFSICVYKVWFFTKIFSAIFRSFTWVTYDYPQGCSLSECKN